MKKMKRLVALLLSVAVLASLCVFSIPVSAEELPKITVTAEEELLIEKLEAFGVIDVKYDAASYVTRRQMAEIIARYMNLSITSSEAETPFRDVKTSDSAYAEIRTLYDMGIITGDNERKFNPDNYVTYDEALVFIINAIGYKMFAEREGGYPTGYHRVAISHGMLKNLSMKLGSDPVKLTDVYRMLESALSAAEVEEAYYGSGEVRYTFSDTETFLSETYGIRKYRGVVTGNEFTRLSNAKASLTDEQIEITSEQGTVVYDTPGYIYGYMLGYTVDYYLKDDSGDGYELKYIQEARNLNDLIKIDVDDLLPDQTTSDRIYYRDADNDEQHITFTDVRDVIYNNQSWHPGSLANALPERGYIEALDNNSDGEYDVLFVYEYVNAIVKTFDTGSYVMFDELTQSNIDLSPRTKKIAVYNAGSTELKDVTAITVGSTLSILESKSTTDKVMTIYISNETVAGTITAYDPDEGYLIGEEYYKAYEDSFDLGDTGLFYLDMNNQLVMYKYDAASDKGVYGVVTAYQKGANRKEDKMTIKIFTSEGEFLVATCADKVKVDGEPYDLENRDELDDLESWLDTYYYHVDTQDHNDNDDTAEFLPGAFLVKYIVTQEGQITSIERPVSADEAGAGKFSIIKETIPQMMVRYNQMITIWEAGADMYATGDYYKFNTAESIIFVTPRNGDVDNEDAYSIQKSVKESTYYRKSGGSTVPVTDFSAYSKGTEATHQIDIFLMKGMAVAQPLSESSLSVVKKITNAADEDGNIVKKLYINEDQELICNETVEIKTLIRHPNYGPTSLPELSQAVETTTTDINTLIENGTIKVGSSIIYGTDVDGKMSSVRVLADYEDGVITPYFRYGFPYDGKNIYVLNDVLWQANSAWENGSKSSTENNVIIGEIVSVATTPGTITCRYLDDSVSQGEFLITITSNGRYSVYDEETKTIEHLTLGNFRAGDKFIASLGRYNEIRSITVFR